jgi:hypothetical protein
MAVNNEENSIITQCITDVMELTEQVSSSDYRLEAFKIILTHLLERRLPRDLTGNQSKTDASPSNVIPKTVGNDVSAEDLPTIVPAG